MEIEVPEGALVVSISLGLGEGISSIGVRMGLPVGSSVGTCMIGDLVGDSEEEIMGDVDGDSEAEIIGDADGEELNVGGEVISGSGSSRVPMNHTLVLSGSFTISGLLSEMMMRLS
mmetsp:Transcript_850/g.1350  ORF Transcript_850/g.1350 Transcript_850/m.1350 type:complete len:116 (-) Transcript_850:1917-2264(-)